MAEFRDPSAIPALIGALGTSGPVTRALARFGEEAVPALLSVVRSSESISYVVDDAMLALRFMIEGAGPHPLSDATLDEIRDVAKQRLTGKQYFTTLWEAMDLASAFSDPGLKRILEALASNRDSVLARGIEDPDLIQETQRLAAKRLAGVPPTLRWR